MVKMYKYKANVEFFGLNKMVEADTMDELAQKLNISHMTLRRILYKDGSRMFRNVKIERTPISKKNGDNTVI